MAKGQAGKADKQLGTTNSIGNTALTNANEAMSSLTPFYQGEMMNPQGLGQPALTAATTASNQALGGATAGAAGAGKLQAERTRNSAGITEALDSSARGAEQQQSENAQNLQVLNAQEKLAQQQAGAQGEQGIFGTETGLGASMYGLGPGTLNARAAGGSWAQNTFNPIMSALSGGAIAGKNAVA